MLQKSLEAVKILEREFDLNVEVIDLQSLRPIDQGTIIESIKKTNRMVIVEESWPFASIGSEIVNIIQEHKDSEWIKKENFLQNFKQILFKFKKELIIISLLILVSLLFVI